MYELVASSTKGYSGLYVFAEGYKEAPRETEFMNVVVSVWVLVEGQLNKHPGVE